jgi:hypothetical protein
MRSNTQTRFITYCWPQPLDGWDSTLATNFPSGTRPCCSRLPSLVFHLIVNLCLVQWFNVQRTSPQAPFLKLSLASTYAAHECYQTKSQTWSNTYTHNPICHKGHLPVVQTCAPTKQIFPLEGPPKRVSYKLKQGIRECIFTINWTMKCWSRIGTTIGAFNKQLAPIIGAFNRQLANSFVQ